LGAPEGAPPALGGGGGVGMGGGADALKGMKMRAVESTPELSGKTEKEKKRPPVSGENRLMGEGGEGVRTRKRTNSFKKGLAGTLRVSECSLTFSYRFLAHAPPMSTQCSPPPPAPDPRLLPSTPTLPLPTLRRSKPGSRKEDEEQRVGQRSALAIRTLSIRGNARAELGARRGDSNDGV
jgi:hypothetical protein